MKITNANLIRWAGACALIGGLCYVFVGVFHPANVPASVVTTPWATVHVVASVMPFFGLLGLVGLYARQAVKSSWLGLVGFILLSLWTTLMTKRTAPAARVPNQQAAKAAGMRITAALSRSRRIPLAAGIAYGRTFVSIPTFALYNSVKGTNYVLGSGPDTAAIVGGLLDPGVRSV